MTARLPLVINSTTIEEIQSGDTYNIGTNATGTTPTFTGTKETSTAISASAIDLSAGNYFTKTISGTTTFTISNAASSGTVNSFILQLTNGGSATVNWFSGVKWAGGTAPTSGNASGIDVYNYVITKTASATYTVLASQTQFK